MLLRERDGSCPRLSKHGLPRLIQIAGCSPSRYPEDLGPHRNTAGQENIPVAGL